MIIVHITPSKSLGTPWSMGNPAQPNDNDPSVWKLWPRKVRDLVCKTFYRDIASKVWRMRLLLSVQ